MRRLRGLVARADGSTLPGTVSFEETIMSVEAAGDSAGSDYVVPAFIDLQLNGADEIDVMDASADALLRLSARLAREGTGGWLPTALTAPLERIEKTAAAIAEAAAEQSARVCDAFSTAGAAARGCAAVAPATILGMHLEGPFISPARLGAHPPFNLAPRGEALRRVAALKPLRLITLAPELDGALEAIAYLGARGVAVSLGHTDATLEQAQAALAAGARMFTHTFNAMAPLHHRRPGAAAAAMLPSRARAAVVADGVHLHPEMLRLLYRARGAAGICLTTDRVATAGEAGVAVAKDGAARTPDHRLAGSVISMLDGARTMIERAGASVGEAALMGATNPARVLGLSDRGKIDVGARADLLVLGSALELKAVLIGGRELA
ncbi:MAG TPA: N-acetylglucosamine-6-phosphate deacetylase [Candidatus Binataceae bacterium]|nr:N-acetylglucosamine-6-phosphate deacetylase [Candidatus Binataceae bacterium]